MASKLPHSKTKQKIKGMPYSWTNTLWGIQIETQEHGIESSVISPIFHYGPHHWNREFNGLKPLGKNKE